MTPPAAPLASWPARSSGVSSGGPLRRRRLGHARLREDELAVLRVDAHRVALGEVALEQAQREWVLDEPLERALEGRAP